MRHSKVKKKDVIRRRSFIKRCESIYLSLLSKMKHV